jgi:Ca2+-transporting ATPase
MRETVIFARVLPQQKLRLMQAFNSWTRLIVKTLRTPNPAIWWVVSGATVTLALAIYVPFLASLFRFAVFHPLDMFLCLAIGFASVL